MKAYFIVRLILPLLGAIVLIFLLLWRTKNQKLDLKLFLKLGIPVVLIVMAISKIFFPMKLYQEDDKDVEGKIMAIKDSNRTAFKLDDAGSWRNAAGLYKGLAIGDSVHHWRNGDW